MTEDSKGDLTRMVEAMRPQDIEEKIFKALERRVADFVENTRPATEMLNLIALARAAWLRYGAKPKGNAWNYQQAKAEVMAMMAAKGKTADKL